MRKLVLVTMGAAFGVAAFGKSPLDCLDQDVLRGLLLQGHTSLEVTIASAVPRELTGFRASEKLIWVGAGERRSQMATPGSTGQVSSTSAVYRSNLDPEAARTEAAAALVAGGWVLHTKGLVGGVEVFKNDYSFPSSDTYCRDGDPVTLTSSAIDGVSYVTLGIIHGLDGNTVGMVNACKEPPRLAVVPVNAMEKFLPRFQLPADPATGKRTSTHGSESAGNDQQITFHTTLVVKDSLGNIASHFARQMAEQGWKEEGTVGSTGSSVSSWTRSGDGASIVRGTLIVSDFDQGRYSIILRATRIN